jgi:hypothetical protein
MMTKMLVTEPRRPGASYRSQGPTKDHRHRWWKRGLLVNDPREVAIAAGLADSVRAVLPSSPEAALPAGVPVPGTVAGACATSCVQDGDPLALHRESPSRHLSEQPTEEAA